MQRRFLLGGLAIFLALVSLSLVSFYQNRELYLEVDQLLAPDTGLPSEVVHAAELQPAADAALGQAIGPRIQLRGLIDKGRVDRGSDGLQIRFWIYGQAGGLPVHYRGVVPDTFDMAETVTVSGQMTSSGVFQADQLLVQCPSKYEALPPGASKTEPSDD